MSSYLICPHCSAYTFWSIFTSLAPTLFYFSIWELGIAGSELSLLSILSPCLLGFSSFRQWCQTRSGRVVLHMLSLSALFAYALPKPQHRLLLVAAGNIFLCIGAVIDWSGASGTSVEYQATRASLPVHGLSRFADWPYFQNWDLVYSCPQSRSKPITQIIQVSTLLPTS